MNREESPSSRESPRRPIHKPVRYLRKPDEEDSMSHPPSRLPLYPPESPSSDKFRNGGRDHPGDSPASAYTTAADSSMRHLLRSHMPDAWFIPDAQDDIHCISSLHLLARRTLSPTPILVSANRPIPLQILIQAARKRSSTRTVHQPSFANHMGNKKQGDTSSGNANIKSILRPSTSQGQQPRLWPTLGNGSTVHDPYETNIRRSTTTDFHSSVDVYYFEATFRAGKIWIGFVPAAGIPSAVVKGRFPGDCPGSIGLASDGSLHVAGKHVTGEVSALSQTAWSEPFQIGDTMGCGLEILGMRRVFFTKNGKLLSPTTQFTGLDIHDQTCLPSVGIAAGGQVIGNFGLGQQFQWVGSDRLSPIPPDETVDTPAANISISFGTETRALSQSTVTTTQDASSPLNGYPRAPSYSSSPGNNRDMGDIKPPASSFGRPTNRKVKLEDDSPLDNSASWHGSASFTGIKSTDSRKDGKFAAQNTYGLKQSTSAMYRCSPPSSPSLNRRARTTSETSNVSTSLEKAEEDDMTMRPFDIENTKSCALELRTYCDNEKVDFSLIQSLQGLCRSNQTRLQRSLQQEDYSAMLDLDELFTLNDFVLECIHAAEERLASAGIEQEPALTPSISDNFSHGSEPQLTGIQSSSLEIDALVQKRDVFSLICMLRAQSEKRLDAALALMRFSRDPSSIRDEIRSSGGMHSLLTLFRTEGVTRELKVVTAMAIAYLLPSFVESSSLFPTSLGLKIVQCLRLLIVSKPVMPRGEEIGQGEMYNASAVGVTMFWINVLFPMLSKDMAQIRKSDTEVRLSLRKPSWRSQGRNMQLGIGGDVLDQRQEILELQELLEMTVSHIVNMAKLCDNNILDNQHVHETHGMQPNLRYLIEQMCAVDVVRPIAVREGLLKVLVGWMKSNDRDKIRCAATSVRDLTSTKDKYMAGWIHSQIVNEGALSQIVKLSMSEFVGHDVRLAVAEILSSLCVAPHTRAAVVEAECINCLIPLLIDGSADPSSYQVAFAAGSALLQLVAGAMTRASVYKADSLEQNEDVSPDKRDTIINVVVQGGALGPFVALASSRDRGPLRAMAIEALRVISEDIHPSRRTRLQLCEVGAAVALGHVLMDDVREVAQSLNSVANSDNPSSRDVSLLPVKDDTIKELHQALGALANILEVPEPLASATSLLHQKSSSRLEDAQETLIKACLQLTDSRGLESLLFVSTIPFTLASSSLLEEDTFINGADLVVDACRSLASLSPLLLSDLAAAQGYTTWSCKVLESFTRILKQTIISDGDGEEWNVATELKIDALRGLGALAKYEPLKVMIIDKSLSHILQAKAVRGDRTDVCNAANQVCLALGFAEDELAVQVAGNDPMLLCDWFCLQRLLLIQSMAREEIRKAVFEIWGPVLDELQTKGALPISLVRGVSNLSNGSGSRSSEEGNEHYPLDELFENLIHDEESSELRKSLVKEYQNVYEQKCTVRGGKAFPNACGCEEKEDSDDSLLSRYVYPLTQPSVEKDWILSHSRFLDSTTGKTQPIDGPVSERVQSLLDCCIPSRILQSEVLPIFDLRPQASFDFRALIMPHRRYFSFRREGQLVSRMCETHAAFLETDNIHWTLGFADSSFAGEFTETLVQALYRCPMIRCLSFANSDRKVLCSTDKDNNGEDGSALLANLAGSLPPWVSCLTYDKILNDRGIRALVAILETLSQLSAGQTETSESGGKEPTQGSSDQADQKQGTFWCFAIRNSPGIKSKSWISFFELLGRCQQPPVSRKIPSLASLRILDISGNMLGDKLCAFVLELAHREDSGCCIEQIDMSRNAICDGKRVAKVLHNYVELHRYNQTAGVKMGRKSWKSPLHTLSLASNGLSVGGLALELIALLKNNALTLKTLDLSGNGLECEGYQFTEVLSGSLVRNSILRCLNLSSNNFGALFIDGLLERLNMSESDSGLVFLELARNTPPISAIQRKSFDALLQRSRKATLERFFGDKERLKVGETLDVAVDDPVLTMGQPNHTVSRQHSNVSRDTINEEHPGPFPTSDESIASSSKRPSLSRLSVRSDGENMITVLFSAPLVFRDDQGKLVPFAKLDFDMERELLWQCLKEASRDIELSFDNATNDRLLATMTKRCSCLHYSGHGHPMYLPLENGKGGPHWLGVDVLRDLIDKGGGARFKFVFVSACHSGLAGETFASAGVPHVVCCQQDSELKDTAALAFTRQFYLALFVGHTVKQAFHQGCNAVRATPNLRNAEAEMKKFVLLPRDGNHDVPVFDARPVQEWPKTGSSRSLQRSKSRRGPGVLRSRSIYFGSARSSELSVRNMMQEDPSPTPPQSFLGREVDMYNVLGEVLDKRLVNVVGDTGLGRSSLVCAVCHYINERSSTIMKVDRIYFVKAKQGRGGGRCTALIRQLLDKLVEDGKTRSPPHGLDLDALFDAICKVLKNAKALIVVDRTELLDASNEEAQDFTMFLSNLFRETRNVRVLLSGRRPLGIPSIGGVVERPYYLGPLSFANTVRLFANLCPHLHTGADRQELFRRLVTDGGQADLLFTDAMVSRRTKQLFAVLGDGIPSRTEKAAYAMSRDQLYSLGNESTMAKTIGDVIVS